MTPSATRRTGAHPRTRHPALSTLCAAAALLLALTACSGTSSSTASSTGAPGRGGSATILLPVEARGLDPVVATPTGIADGNRLAALYDVLFWTDPATGTVQPGIGESLTTSDDGTTWTMRLHPGVRFSDGTPFDADAVAYTYQRHADPALHSAEFGSIRGVTMHTVDPLTLQLVLPAPNAHFDKLVAKNLTYIASPTALRADPQGFSAHPVGAGPFVLKDWTRGDHMTLVRNPGYWRPDGPKLDQLTFRVVQDTNQELDTVAASGAEGLVTPDYALIDRARKLSLGVDESELSGGKMITFNTAKPPFNDPRARRAVALALDPADFTKVVYDGKGPVADSIFAPSSPYHAAPTTHGPDLAQAQQLLDQLAAEGHPLNFTYTTYQSPPSVKSAEYIQAQLGRLKNVHMSIETLEAGAATLKMQVNRDFQAAMFTLWIDDPEPLLYNFLRSGNPGDWTGYADPAVDQALDQARATTDAATRTRAYTLVQQRLAQDLPILTFQNAVAAAIHRTDLTGVTLFNDGTMLADRIGLRR